uniref:Uncharacterized protein n=1 Tax=Avena sativa TaxID=4498 RepID=A0ACD5TN45_AVESA
MSEDSCNSLIEQLRTLKIQPSSNPSSENNNGQLGTQEVGAPFIGETTSKTILSPIAVRCAGRSPSLRKESKVDKLIREAREKKKKAEQREKKKTAQKEKKKSEQEARSIKLKNKRSNAKRKSLENDILKQAEMGHEGSFNLGINTSIMNPTMTVAVPSGTIQESLDLDIISNINPTMAASLPSGSSSAIVMPPILGTYTSMLFQVQQNTMAQSNSAELNFSGSGMLNETMDQKQNKLYSFIENIYIHMKSSVRTTKNTTAEVNFLYSDHRAYISHM